MAKHINNILEFISSWGNSEFSSSLLSEVLSPEDILNKAKDEKDEKKRTSLYTMAKSRKKRVDAIQGKVTKIEKDLENPNWRAKGEDGRYLPNQKALKMAEKERPERGKDILSRVGNDPKRIQKRRLDIDIENLDPEKESRRQGIFQKKIDRFTNRTDETSSSKKSDKPKEAEKEVAEVPSIGAPADEADVPSIAAPAPPTPLGRLKNMAKAAKNMAKAAANIDPAMALAGLGLATDVASFIRTAGTPFTGPGGKNPRFRGSNIRSAGTNAYIIAKMVSLNRRLKTATDPDEQKSIRAELNSIRRSSTLGGFMGRYNT